MNTLTHILNDFVIRRVTSALACLSTVVLGATLLAAGSLWADDALAENKQAENEKAEKAKPATINIFASIEPLALMARSVGGNRVSVSTLLEAGVTPHDFSYRVSQRRQLAEADLVLWVGADLEPYLQGPLSNSNAQQHSLAMESLVNLQNTEHPDTDVEERDHPHKDVSLVGDTHPSHDPHLWLSRQAGQAMLLALAAKLSELDPAHGHVYLHNAEVERQRLQALKVANVGEPAKAYATSHSAFEYMLEEFHLPEPLVLSPSPEVAPSAKRLWQLRQTLTPDDCLLVSWPKPLDWQQKLADKNGYRLEVIDVMGYSEEVTTYFGLFETLLAQLHTCLKPN